MSSSSGFTTNGNVTVALAALQSGISSSLGVNASQVAMGTPVVSSGRRRLQQTSYTAPFTVSGLGGSGAAAGAGGRAADGPPLLLLAAACCRSPLRGRSAPTPTL